MAGEDVADDLAAVRVDQALLDGVAAAGQLVEREGVLGVDRPLHGEVGEEHAAFGGADLDGVVTGEVEVGRSGRERGHVGHRRLQVQAGLPDPVHLAEGGGHAHLVRLDDVRDGGESDDETEGGGQEAGEAEEAGRAVAASQDDHGDAEGEEQDGYVEHWSRLSVSAGGTAAA